MMKRFLACLMAFHLLFSTAGGMEKILFDNLDGRTELLSARCVTQDSTGRIWFGTDKRLYSYDGYTLSAHPSEFGRMQVNALAVTDGKLLLCCNNGLFLYDDKTESFSSFPYFQDNIVQAVAEHDGILYVGTETGLYAFRWKEPESSTSSLRLCTDNIFSLWEDGDTLWVGTIDGLGKYSFAGKQYDTVPLNIPGGRRVITTIYPYQDSILWLGTPHVLLELDTRTGLAKEKLPLQVPQSIARYTDNLYLIGTDNGLISYCPGTDESEKILEGTFWGLFSDREGNLWAATGNGLLINRPDRLLQQLDTGDAPANAQYAALFYDSRGRLWAGGSDGLLLYEPEGSAGYRLIRRYTMDGKVWQIPHNRVKAITEDRSNGNIYVATDAGCLLLDEPSGQFQRLRIEGSNDWVYDILIDGNDLWMATFDGLYRMSGQTVNTRYTTTDGLSTNDVARLARDRSGVIWILTRDQRVFTLDPRTNVLQAYSLEEQDRVRFVDCLTSDLEGRIWMAAGRELFRIDNPMDRTSIRALPLESSPSLEVFSLCDFLGQMCACSSEGIWLVDKEDGTSRHINTGMHYIDAAYDAREDRIVFGAPGEISFFPGSELDRMTGNQGLPVTITSVLVNDQTEIPRADILSGALTLGPRENNLRVFFSDFDYGNEIPHRFQVSFSGHRTAWTEAVSGNSISLPDLHPGRYRLSISSSDHLEDAQGMLSIRIRHPWYRSWPMMIIYLLAIGSAIFWIIRYISLKNRLDAERRERALLLEQSKQKEAFFGDIAHEFKTPLSLIIAPLAKLLQETTDPKERKIIQVAHENAGKLNALVHHTIDYYNDTNRTTNDLIRTEVEFVEFARAIFLSYKDNYPRHEFIFDSSEPSMVVDVDIVKMEAVLNNLLSNACKYTPEGGSVILTLEREKPSKHLIIKVSDTGIGIPKDELQLVFQRYFESSRSKTGGYDSTGIGLSLIKQYIENHGGTVSADSDDNGSTFTVVIPYTSDGLATGSGSQTGSGPTDRALVVIVDDNPQICAFLESVLKDKYRCISSNNGKSGLKLCKDVLPDLVIADVMMPVMDGLEMCRQIREYGPLSTIPIVLLTAKGDKETEKRSISLGIDSFIPKPFELPNLTARIDQLIGNKQRMEQKLRMEYLTAPQDNAPLSYDEKYLKKVTQIIEEHMDDSDLSVTRLCELGDFSEKLLYRKLKQLTGLSTVEYIRSVRLKKAAILLQNGNFTVSEAMYSVGFSNASYFTRAFSAQYGKTPSEYLKQYKKQD